ncbi:unnamed protein product [Cuscuta campestris]|uniref:Uncharacterized protein n=1 Tax=Cuscuta campestris TaxID=132261 RepID=A0A484KC42_9ASTE|nr:unnamed protein product [Cuscuta campestris]
MEQDLLITVAEVVGMADLKVVDGGQNPLNNNRRPGHDEQVENVTERTYGVIIVISLVISLPSVGLLKEDDEFNLAKVDDEPTLLMIFLF